MEKRACYAKSNKNTANERLNADLSLGIIPLITPSVNDVNQNEVSTDELS